MAAGFFLLLGWEARDRKRWAFVLGMIVNAPDGLVAPLAEAAIKAVRKWRYEPLKLDGMPTWSANSRARGDVFAWAGNGPHVIVATALDAR